LVKCRMMMSHNNQESLFISNIIFRSATAGKRLPSHEESTKAKPLKSFGRS
jgi:hypothetical protein